MCCTLICRKGVQHMTEEKKSSYKGYTAARGKSSMEYAKRSLKRIPLDVQLEEYEQIKAAAEHAGVPVNTFIKTAVRAAVQREMG